MGNSLNMSGAMIRRIAAVIGLSLGMGAALAADAAGTVKTVKGSVTLERAGQKMAVVPGTPVQAADRMLTGADGSVGITLRDNTLLSAGPNSTLHLDQFSFNSTTHAGKLEATVKRGTLAVISGKLVAASPDSVRFRTPTTTLGVRGTEFVIEVAERSDN